MSLQGERINLGYFLALGRYAKSEEMNYWKKRSDASGWDVKRFVDNHASWLASSQGAIELEATLLRATEAAWSKNHLYRMTSQGTVYARFARQVGRGWRTYVDMINILTEDMDRDKKFKESVVRQSYKDAAITPSGNDVWGWVNGLGSKKPYAQMMAEHLIWKAGKQGKNTSALDSSPRGAVAEAFNVTNARLVAAGGGNLVAAGGGNLVAAGGGNLVAAGGGNIALIGNGRLIVLTGSALQNALASGLVGNDGASIMSIDGARLVGNDGASLARMIRVDAASFIPR